MKIKIKRIDVSMPLPEYQTSGSIGFDLAARVTTKVEPGQIALIPLNVVIKTPKGYGLFLFSRSSTPLKKGLIVANSVGVIDQDYCGEDDELKVQMLNISKKTVVVEKGERIAQALFARVAVGEFAETKSMSKKSRGGFGSTG